MKRHLVITIILIIVTGIAVFTVFMLKHTQGKPTLTKEERIRKLNNFINNSLAASEDMYLKTDSSRDFLTIEEFPELRGITANLTHSIKIKDEYTVDTFQYDKPQRIYFRWGDRGDNTIVIMDIGSDSPDNQIYVAYEGVLYKGEASSDSIQQVTQFLHKIK